MRFDKRWVALLVAFAAWLGACEEKVEPTRAAEPPGVVELASSAEPSEDGAEVAAPEKGKGQASPVVEEAASPEGEAKSDVRGSDMDGEAREP